MNSFKKNPSKTLTDEQRDDILWAMAEQGILKGTGSKDAKGQRYYRLLPADDMTPKARAKFADLLRGDDLLFGVSDLDIKKLKLGIKRMIAPWTDAELRQQIEWTQQDSDPDPCRRALCDLFMPLAVAELARRKSREGSRDQRPNKSRKVGGDRGRPGDVQGVARRTCRGRRREGYLGRHRPPGRDAPGRHQKLEP